MFRFSRHIYGCPYRDVDRCIDVGVGLVAARPTLKLVLRKTIALFAMSAPCAGAAGVAGVHGYDGNAVEITLVNKELAELGERPPAHLCPLVAPEPDSLSDAFEVFKGEAAMSVFGVKNERLADNVVDVLPEPAFLVSDPLHGSMDRTSAALLATTREAHRAAGGVVFDANCFDMFAADILPVAGGDEFRHTHIDANELPNVDGCAVRHVDAGEQVELVASEHKVALPFDTVESSLLVLSEDHRNDLSTLQREQADERRPLESHDSLIVGHRAVRLENRALFLISLKALDGLPDRTNGHLAGQAVLGPQIEVAKFVNVRLTEPLRFKTNPRCIGRGGVKCLHRGEQLATLFGVGKQLKLQGQFHTSIVGLV